ncbi:MAG: SPOR domain-containing protein [Pseudomonadota bacterium]|nr:SPOR domain-containing protein [Pseudomonadota bacterium]
MNTLRNFVVIFFLGIVIFIAGVMVGKSMTDNAPGPVVSSSDTVVTIPGPKVMAGPQVNNRGHNEKNRADKPAIDDLMPLPVVSPEKNAAVIKGQRELSGNEAPESKQEIKYTFYESLTNKKTRNVLENDGSAMEKVAKPVKKERQLNETKNVVKAKQVNTKGLTLQVASYPQEGKARLFRNTLTQEGYGKAVVVAAKIPGKGTWYRVRIVDIKGKQTAKLLQERLRKQKSIRSFIVK